MRLYEFINQDKSIDVTVVTDGIANQQKIFITETPRGISVPGQIETSPNTNNEIFGMGFNFVSGTERYHNDFVQFARSNNLELIQWNEGLGEVSPETVVTGSNAVFTADPSSLSFAKTAAPAQTVEVVSTLTPWGGVAANLPFEGYISKASSVFSVDLTKTPIEVSAVDNPTAEDILGELTLLQPYTGKKVVVSLTSKGS